MKTSEHSRNIFYQKLAYLFYSVANADLHVADEEVTALHKMVVREWLHLDESHDSVGGDAAFQIEIVFDWIRENGMSSEAAFHKFEKYYKENPIMFDEVAIGKIIKTSNAIADSFHGTNKAEHAALHRIHALLGVGQES